MPGNEIITIKFFFKNINKLELNHIGLIEKIEIPRKEGLYRITNKEEIDKFKSDDSRKKADVYLNNIGISLKQEGGHFDFNRLQRRYFFSVFSKFFNQKENINILDKLDNKISECHNGKGNINTFVSVEDIMNYNNFKKIHKYLMFDGSPAYGDSKYKAKFIIKSKEKIDEFNDIKIYSYDEYFEKFKKLIFIRLSRHFYGSGSKSEHNRARGLINNKDNKPWCFKNTKGVPDSGWRKEIEEKDRQTTYTLSIEQKKRQKNET